VEAKPCCTKPEPWTGDVGGSGAPGGYASTLEVRVVEVADGSAGDAPVLPERVMARTF
jgi:hypothetical protein